VLVNWLNFLHVENIGLVFVVRAALNEIKFQLCLCSHFAIHPFYL
jgi:hypothetical protein